MKQSKKKNPKSQTAKTEVSVFRFQFFYLSSLTPDPPLAEHLKP